MTDNEHPDSWWCRVCGTVVRVAKSVHEHIPFIERVRSVHVAPVEYDDEP